MIFKSFSLSFSELIKKNLIHLYGENLPLINELEEKIVQEIKKKLGLNSKRYQEEFLINNPEIFTQLIESENLFGEQEIIIIQNSSDKILNILEQNTINNTSKKIIFISGILNKKSKLRIIGENSANFASIACYHDTPEILKNILIQKLKENKVPISRELLNYITETYSLNRQDINDSIIKIKLLQKTSSLNDKNLKNIFHSSSENDNFEIVNYCLLGDKKNINKILTNIYSQGINFNEILAALKYKVNKLIEILKSNNNKLSINNLVENYKPPIFWKEKNVIKDQLNRWNIQELYLLQNIIFETEINCKKNYDISSIILQQFIVTTSTKSCLDNKLY